MENETYNRLLNLVKILDAQNIDFPIMGYQSRTKIISKIDATQRFEMLINRKGHKRENPLTLLMESKYHGNMVRFDINGSSHDDRHGNPVETPHIHIFDEIHNQGKWAVPLSDISSDLLIYELHDGLIAFLEYNNINIGNSQIPLF